MLSYYIIYQYLPLFYFIFENNNFRPKLLDSKDIYSLFLDIRWIYVGVYVQPYIKYYKKALDIDCT